MTFDQLRIFVVVARELNMRRAGEMLFLTQPAVSAAIHALETRYETKLFDRVGRGLELNAAGRSFLPEAQAVLARADEAQRVLDDLSCLLRGEVRIAASQTVASYWLPVRMARFTKAYPRLAVSLTTGNSTQAAAALMAGEADLAFVEGAVDEDLLQARRVGGDAFSLYSAPGHPLAGRPLDENDLREAVWVFREHGSGTRDHLEAALSGMGLTASDLSIRLEMPSNEAVLGAVEAGGLIAGVSDLAAASRVALGQLVRLDFALPSRDFRVLFHRARRRSHATATFEREICPTGPVRATA